MPAHIRAHSILVARIAKLISLNLKSLGADISVKLTVSGALMHDIAKFPCIQSHENHCIKGKDICEKEGFHEISDIVNEHVVLQHTVTDNEYNEKEIVNYADKRVLHDRIVSIQERMNDIFVRYMPKCPHIDQVMFDKHCDICHSIEKKIFTRLQFLPQDVPEWVAGILL